MRIHTAILPRIGAVLALALIVSTARAGIPKERDVTCPVGGERFAITTTSSCTTLGRRMSAEPITSCDFVTRLPVCPANGLPMFKTFTRSERAFLTDFLTSPDWQSLRQLPPWHRAYALAERLDQTGTDAGFAVILNASWVERDVFLSRPASLAAFGQETDAAIARQPQNAGQLHAMAAFVLAQAGRDGDALNRIRLALAANPEGQVQAYIAQVRNCIGNMSQPRCDPNAPFQPTE